MMVLIHQLGTRRDEARALVMSKHAFLDEELIYSSMSFDCGDFSDLSLISKKRFIGYSVRIAESAMSRLKDGGANADIRLSRYRTGHRSLFKVDDI